MRNVDGDLHKIDAELSDMVLPGDTIMVPERFF